MTYTMKLLFVTLISGVLSSQPNIIVIIADDMGWNDVGFHGLNQVPTPNIDALAYHGIILNRHYTLPTCTPSRTSYMTGKYPIRTGMQGSPLEAGEPRGIPLSEKLLPERLQQLGYVTRLVGKWHAGAHMTSYTPTRRGFHSHLGYWNGYIGYFDHSITSVTDHMQNLTGHDFYENLRPAWELQGEYATDVFTREAVSVIRSHNTSRPLYLHMAHLAVHSGNTSTPLEVPDPEATAARFPHILDPDRRTYAGMLTSLDESVGTVVSALADKGMLNNSIILFMSDNGAPTFGKYANTGSNWPLRGIKGTQFEGGVRCVCNVWSPLFYTKGTVSSQLVHISDWLPTFYTAAGGNVSDLGELDGVDQWPSLVGRGNDTDTPPRRQVLVNIDDAGSAESVIHDDWKLVRRWSLAAGDAGYFDGYYGESGRDASSPGYEIAGVLGSLAAFAVANATDSSLDEDAVLRIRSSASSTCPDVPAANTTLSCGPVCLFHLSTDPCETTDVAADHEDVVRELTGYLQQYRSVMVPQMNRPVDIRSNPDLYNGSWVPWLDFLQPSSTTSTTTAPLYLLTILSALIVLNGTCTS